MEASKSTGGTAEVKKADSLFGSLFGSKPTSAPSVSDGDSKKLHEEIGKLKHDMETQKTAHATALKAAQDEKLTVQSRLDASEKSHADKDAKMTTIVNMQATVANKLVDAEAQLEVTRTQLEALKIELSSRPAHDMKEIDEATAKLREELDATKAERENAIGDFSQAKADWEEERASMSRASADTCTLLEKQIQEARAETESVRNEKSALQTKLAEQREQLLAEMSAAADKDNSQFVAFRKQLDDAIAEKETAEARSSALAKDLDSKSADLDTTRSQNTLLEAQLKTATEMTVTLQEQAKEKATEEESRIAKLAQLEASLAQAQAESNNSAQQLKSMTAERDAAVEQKRALELEHSTVSAQRETEHAAKHQEVEQQKTLLQEQVDKVTKEKADQLKKSKTLKTKLTKVQDEVKQATQEVTAVKELNTQHQAKIEKLEAEAASQTVAISSVSQDRDTLLARLTEIKMNSDAVSEKLIATEHERDEMAKYRDMYENEAVAHATVQSLVDSLLEKVKTLDASVQAGQSKLDEAHKEADAAKTKFVAELAVSASEIEKLNAEIAMMEQRLGSSKEQLERERAKTKDLERDLDLEKDKTLQLSTSKKEIAETLEKTTQQLTSELEEHKTRSQLENEELQRKLDETSSRLSYAQSALEETSSTLEQLKLTHATLMEEKDTMAAQHTEKTEALEKSSTEALDRIALLERQLEDKDMEAKIAEKQNLMTIQQLKAQVKTLETPQKPTAVSRTISSSLANSASTGSVPNKPKLANSQNTAASQAAGVARSASSSSHIRTSSAGNAPSTSTASVSTSSGTSVPTDIDALSQRIGELTQQNFALSEQLKSSEEAKRKAEKDSRLKSKWIQQNSPKLKLLETASQPPSDPSSSTPTRLAKSSGTNPQTPTNAAATPNKGTPKRAPQEQGFFSSLFGSTSSPARTTPQEPSERQVAVSTMLEDTLLEKMQLEDELKLVSTDVETLQRQNRLLMETLVSHSIEVPMLENVK